MSPYRDIHELNERGSQMINKAASEQGTALAEWALLVVLIAIIALIGVSVSGDEVSGQYSNIASALETT